MTDTPDNAPQVPTLQPDRLPSVFEQSFALAALPPEALDPVVLLGKYTAHPYAMQYAQRFAAEIERSNMTPKSLRQSTRDGYDERGTQAAVCIAILHGARLGFHPLQAVQNIACVNGKPGIYGDAYPALMQSHGIKLATGDNGKPWGPEFEAWATIERDGHLTRRTFSYDDAKRAGLLTKDGPWKNYPTRMCMHRARTWACRDGAADITQGIDNVEEMVDTPEALPAPVVQVYNHATGSTEQLQPGPTAVADVALGQHVAPQVSDPDPEPPAEADPPAEVDLGAEPRQSKLWRTKTRRKPKNAKPGDRWESEADAGVVHVLDVDKLWHVFADPAAAAAAVCLEVFEAGLEDREPMPQAETSEPEQHDDAVEADTDQGETPDQGEPDTEPEAPEADADTVEAGDSPETAEDAPDVAFDVSDAQSPLPSADALRRRLARQQRYHKLPARAIGDIVSAVLERPVKSSAELTAHELDRVCSEIELRHGFEADDVPPDGAA